MKNEKFFNLADITPKETLKVLKESNKPFNKLHEAWTNFLIVFAKSLKLDKLLNWLSKKL